MVERFRLTKPLMPSSTSRELNPVHAFRVMLSMVSEVASISSASSGTTQRVKVTDFFSGSLASLLAVSGLTVCWLIDSLAGESVLPTLPNSTAPRMTAATTATTAPSSTASFFGSNLGSDLARLCPSAGRPCSPALFTLAACAVATELLPPARTSLTAGVATSVGFPLRETLPDATAPAPC